MHAARYPASRYPEPPFRYETWAFKLRIKLRITFGKTGAALIRQARIAQFSLSKETETFENRTVAESAAVFNQESIITVLRQSETC